jgi:hypothetical protein
MRFVIRDPKKAVPDLLSFPGALRPLTQDVVGLSADAATRCCVSPPRDPGSSRKQCFTYFLTVVHFRKLLN